MKRYIQQVFFTPDIQNDEFNYFSNKLKHETDIADLAFDYYHDLIDYSILDVRSKEDYELCHIPGAISCPGGRVKEEQLCKNVVVYCWGPSCNGSTKAALRLKNLGYTVKELIGGIEYWRKEGCPIAGSETENSNLYWNYNNLS